jgi:hypothetical protein
MAVTDLNGLDLSAERMASLCQTQVVAFCEKRARGGIAGTWRPLGSYQDATIDTIALTREAVASAYRCQGAQRLADSIVQNAKEQIQKIWDSKPPPRSPMEKEVLEQVRNSQEQIVVLQNWLALLKTKDLSTEVRALGEQYLALESTKDLRSELPRSAGGTMKWLNSKQTEEWLRNYEREHSTGSQ